MSAKLPPDLQSAYDELMRTKDRNTNSDVFSPWSFLACYKTMQAQADRGFNEDAALYAAQTNPNADADYFCSSVFIEGARWQHSRNFAAMQDKDARIAELEESLRKLAFCDDEYQAEKQQGTWKDFYAYWMDERKRRVAAAKELLKGQNL